jgi:hypothetical protein
MEMLPLQQKGTGGTIFDKCPGDQPFSHLLSTVLFTQPGELRAQELLQQLGLEGDEHADPHCTRPVEVHGTDYLSCPS